MLDIETFNDCLDHWSVSSGNQPFWEELAQKYGFKSGEVLRSKFKRDRQKRGISRESVTSEVVRDFTNFPKIGIIDIEMLPGRADIWANTATS